ncbi:unnamed protein product, partial [Polarella glacialis]
VYIVCGDRFWWAYENALSQARGAEARNPDPLAQTVKTIGAVSTMRYFWVRTLPAGVHF